MIGFKNFSFKYNEKEDFTLKNINLTINEGEFILITGRSGCGKTTLIRTLNGLIPYFYPGEIKGELSFKEESLIGINPSDLVGKIGMIFQDPRSQFFMTDTTREMAFGCENIGLTSDETVERVSKATLELNLIEYLNRNIFELSSGEKQQIAIGSVYALSPKVFIFDEPSANLDYEAIKKLSSVMSDLKNNGYTIIVVEHRFYYLMDLIDKVYLMHDGEIKEKFIGDQFSLLDDDVRIEYGLRTTNPKKEMYTFKNNSICNKDAVLKVDNLSFHYKNGVPIFENVSFEASSGDVIGVIGSNGAGKTTLISVLTGILKEKHGSVMYKGKKLSAKDRKNLSYLVMQDTDYQLFSDSVLKELTLGISENVALIAKETLDKLNLSLYQDTHPAALSGGQKQRVTVGAAIVKGSPVIYFDEPTSGLDYDSMIRVSELIKSLSTQGNLVFVISHDCEFIVRSCSKILRLSDNNIELQTLSDGDHKSLLQEFFN